MSRRRPDDEDDDPREGIQERRPQQRRSGPPPSDEDDDERPRRRPARDDDEDEDRPRRRPARGDYDDRPKQTNGFALTGYYMGFLGLIAILGGFAFIIFRLRNDPLGFSPALAAIIVFGVIYGLGGISALLGIIFGGVGLAKASSRGSGTGHSVVGIVLGSLEIIGLIVITLMGAIVTHRG